MRQVSLLAAAEAAEQLASELLGYDVSKAIDPLSDAGFLLISKLVAKKLAKVAEGQERAAVSEMLRELDLDWAKMSTEATNAALKAINASIAKAYSKRILPKIATVFEAEGSKNMRTTRLSVIARDKLKAKPELSERAISADAAIRKSHINFIRDSSGVRAEALSETARKLVASGVKNGLSTEQITRRLTKKLNESVPRPSSYWSLIAEAFVGQGRTFSQIAAYTDAGIETYEIVAVLDDVTSDICRFMDGRVFEVAATQSLLDSLAKLEDPEEVRYANPWVRKGADPDGGARLYVPHADGSTTTIARIERSGVGKVDDRGEYSAARSDAELASLGIPVPPFHGRCRSTIVAGTK